MALMSPTADFGANDPGADDTEYDAAVKSGDIRNVMAVLEKQYRLPAGYLAKTAQVESRMNPNAQNPNSSAGGLFQFIDSTAKRYGLTDKMDPVQSTLAAAQLAGDNADYLSDRLGRDPTTPELYAAHQQGAAGAARILSQPNAMMSDLVGSRAARLNGAGNLTGGQFIDRFAQKLGANSPSTTVSTAPTAPFSSDDPTTTGSIGSAGGFSNGVMGKPYQQTEEGGSPILQAIGMALATGTRFNPLGNFASIYQGITRDRQTAENQRYGRWNDDRNFALRQQEAARAQGNTDRSFGLQEKQFGLSQQNTEADNKRADAALDLQRQQAGAPKIMQDSTGGIVSVTPDGKTVTTLAPGQRVMTEAGKVEERKRIAEAYGLQPGTPEYNNYTLFNKPPDEMKAPTTKNIKQADGSEVSVQWDPEKKAWGPLAAPEGGAAVRAGPANPFSNQTGGKTTGEQDKSGGFTDRMLANEQTIRGLETQGASAAQKGWNAIPFAGSYLTSDDFKKYNAAKNNWIAAQLRKESGAAISASEYDQADKQYFPQPNDPPQLIEQKRRLRETAIKGMARDSGPSYVPSHTFDENGQMQPYKRPGAGSAKPAAADRFQALIAGGASKADAYAKMKEEGY